jgi:periplasmic protein TonB
MRFFPALVGALSITIAIFLFMQSLIERGKDEGIQLAVYTNVEVFRQQREQEEPEPEQETPREPAEEPAMDALTVTPVSPSTPEPASDLELPKLDFGVGDINIQAVGKSWSGPLASGTVNLGGGADAQGFIEVIPYNTRRPNVPEVAWQNKVNGWVLVAFSVSPEGKTRNVRVLDANPRGVFEEKVVAAVEDWLYSVKFYGKGRSDVILTQKVEVRWENFPQNLPYVD